jgi:hypothetical protein
MPEEIVAMFPVKVSTLGRRMILQIGAASVVIAGLGAGIASAADLDHRALPNDRYRSAYEDPRYADLYAPTPPPIVQHRSYQHVPIPRERVYRDDAYDHRDAPPPQHTYTYRPYDQQNYGQQPYTQQPYSQQAPRFAERPGCVSPRSAQRSLEQDGWRDFSGPVLRGETAFLNARRPDGRPFELQVDRCSGELVNARPLDQRPYGSNVYGGRYEPRAF